MLLRYFAFGSNMHPARLRSRLGEVARSDIACLADYRLAFHKRGADTSGKADIVPAAGAEVWGVIYPVTPVQAEILDRVEGSGYTRVDLAVRQHADGIAVAVFAYQAHPGAIGRGLEPFDWYLGYLLRGAEHHGLPPRYRRWLAGHATITDDNDSRARRERALVARV